MVPFNVFITGMSIMAIEMTAFRYLAPYFGTTQLIITNIIGTILLAIAIGNWIGGKAGDRYHSRKGISYILMAASFLTLLIMLLSRPILSKASIALSEQNMPMFAFTLATTVLLFSLPFVLLGMVSPYSIRVLSLEKENVGRNAGLVYFLGTFGSLIGTYLPTFVFIPLWGSTSTLIIFALLLFVTATIGLLKEKEYKFTFFSFILISILSVSLSISESPLQRKGLLASKESLYNLIQVVKEDSKTKLYLNEGHGYHSVLKEDSVLVEGIWDYFLSLPAMLPQKDTQLNVLIIGLAAGTISNIYSHYIEDPLHIDGVEIDKEITDLAEQYFSLDKRFLDIHHEDGRTFLSRKRGPYDIIIVDAYKQPYIPWHLTTVEFFESCKQSLKKGGILGINVATLKNNSKILNCLEVSLANVFQHLHKIKMTNADIEFTNNLLIASIEKPQITGLSTRFKNAPPYLLREVENKIHKITPDLSSIAFTDDWAPVEWYVDLSLFSFFK